MKLAHTGDNGLTGFIITLHGKGRVLVGQGAESSVKLISVCRGLGLDGDRNNGFGKAHGFENNRMIFITESITGSHIFETDSCGNVAAVNLFAFFTLVCVHLKNTSETFAFACSGIVNNSAAGRHTGIYTEIDELSDIGIVHDLECKRRERNLIADFAAFRLIRIGVRSMNFPDIDRRREIINYRIKEKLNTLVFECSSAERGNELTGKHCTAKSLFQEINGGNFIIQENFHDGLVIFRDAFDHESSCFGKFFLHIFRNGNFLDVHFIKLISLLLHDIDKTFEIGLGADRENHRNYIGFEFCAHGVHYFVEVCAGSVHLIDECNNGNMIFFRLSPDGFSLRLNTADCTENSNSAVQNTE